MLGRAGTATKLQGKAGTGRDGYKTTVRLLEAVPESSKKGKHTDEIAAESQNGTGWDGYKTAVRLLGAGPE